MIDYFALLHQPRRPWLDPAVLKEQFLALSKEVHPDKFHNSPAADKAVAQERYAELTTAFNCLRSPKARLLHLIELETGSRPQTVDEVPPAITEFFMEVMHTMRETDAFLRQWSAVSGLVKAQMFAQAQEWVEKLQATMARINAEITRLDAELIELTDHWAKEPNATAKFQPRLVDLYRLFSFYSRWAAQIQDRLTRLAV